MPTEEIIMETEAYRERERGWDAEQEYLLYLVEQAAEDWDRDS